MKMKSKAIFSILCILLTCTITDVYGQEEAVLFQLDGKPLNGKIQRYNDYDIKVEDVTYEKGMRTGIRKTYYRNGVLFSEGKYVQGKLEGEYKTFYENGKTKGIYAYQEGLKEGISKFYDDDGKIEYETLFRNDKKELHHRFYDNGKIKYTTTYVEGIITQQDKFTSRGKLDQRSYYKNEKVIKIDYYENGKFSHGLNFD